jgi:hypothetical protein
MRPICFTIGKGEGDGFHPSDNRRNCATEGYTNQCGAPRSPTLPPGVYLVKVPSRWLSWKIAEGSEACRVQGGSRYTSRGAP